MSEPRQSTDESDPRRLAAPGSCRQEPTPSPRRHTSLVAAAIALSVLPASACGESAPKLPEISFRIVSSNPSMNVLGFASEWGGEAYDLLHDGAGNYVPLICSGTTTFTSDRAEATLDWQCAVDAASRKFLENLSGTLTHDSAGEYEGPVTVTVHATNPARVLTYELIMRIGPGPYEE